MLHCLAYRSLYRYISHMEVVDGHEHLYPEAVRSAMPVDFSSFLMEYSSMDLRSAGLSAEDYAAFFSSETPVEKKWALVEPYMPAIDTLAYTKAVKLTLRKYYGEKELNAANYAKITDAMRRRNAAGQYEAELADSRIRYALVSSFPRDVRPEQLNGRLLYVPMYYVSGDAAKDHGLMCHPESLADLEKEADDYAERALKGARAVKVRVDLLWQPVTAEQAAAALEEWNGGKRDFCPEICWYFVELLLQRCAKHDMPVCIHTGYWGNLRDASPENLVPLVQAHPNNRFNFFHLGYPYVRQSLLLAKMFPNIWIDLCWVYLISEEMARDAIRQIVDLVPMNKVMGFGADYWHIDNVYGHRKMMDRTMALALADKVADGTLTLAQAKRWAKAMLWDNPVHFYGLQ